MGVRISSGLQSIVAVGGGVGALVATGGITAHPLSLNKRAVIKRIMWRNRIGVNANLLIGYGDLTVAGSLFRQVMPSILMVNGIDGELTEAEIPVVGNGPEGFVADTTPVTGSLGNIVIETDGAAGAAPLDVQVVIEVEEE